MERKTRKCYYQASQPVNHIYHCVYRVLVDDTKESVLSFALQQFTIGSVIVCTIHNLARELECNDEKNLGSGVRPSSDAIPTLQLFSCMALIILAKLMRAYHTPGSLVYNPCKLILTNPINIIIIIIWILTQQCVFVDFFLRERKWKRVREQENERVKEREREREIGYLPYVPD